MATRSWDTPGAHGSKALSKNGTVMSFDASKEVEGKKSLAAVREMSKDTERRITANRGDVKVRMPKDKPAWLLGGPSFDEKTTAEQFLEEDKLTVQKLKDEIASAEAAAAMGSPARPRRRRRRRRATRPSWPRRRTS
jgi:hypothetical protein